MLEGCLRVGNARYYRLLELVSGDEWIGDKAEATAVGDTGPLSITPSNSDPKTLQMLEDNRIANISPGSSFIVKDGVKIISYAHCYIFSFSVGVLENLKSIMCDTTRPQYAYNGCLEILDIEGLCECLWSKGKVDEKPLQEFFTKMEHGAVKYSGQLNDPWSAPIQADPFLKAQKYTSQSEYRIIFHSRPETKGDHKTILFPDVDKFFRIAFQDLTSSPPSKKSQKRTKKETVTHLANIQKIMKKQSDKESQLFIDRHDNALEESARMRAEFNEEFVAHHLRPLIEAYWALRSHHPSEELDRALDPYLLSSQLYLPLSEYLFGPNYMSWDNEYMWESMKKNTPEPCLFEQLINDKTVLD